MFKPSEKQYLPAHQGLVSKGKQQLHAGETRARRIHPKSPAITRNHQEGGTRPARPGCYSTHSARPASDLSALGPPFSAGSPSPAPLRGEEPRVSGQETGGNLTASTQAAPSQRLKTNTSHARLGGAQTFGRSSDCPALSPASRTCHLMANLGHVWSTRLGL